jgi:hypothetical protein
MQTDLSSRETILNAIRNNLPKQRVERPAIPGFAWRGGPRKAAFERHLQEAGGAAHEVASAAEATPS